MGPRFFFLSLFVATGFFHLAQTGATVTDSIFTGNTFRKYRLYIPAAYDGSKSYPLVLNLHGLGSNGTQQQLYANFMPVADTAQFFVVQPEGTPPTPYWNAGVFPGPPDDLLFLTSLIDSLVDLYNVDKDRVYSCGISNGAIMSYYLACQTSGRFAAIASVAGTMFEAWYKGCHPQFAMPVMEIHGTDDQTLPYAGSGQYKAVDSIIAKWRKHNQCYLPPEVKVLQDISVGDSSTVTHYRYAGGADNSAVELFKVEGGSHSWPGALPVIPNTNQDFSATQEIWRFFRQYRASQFISLVEADETSEDRASIYPNPASDYIFVPECTGCEYFISGMFGEKIQVPTSGKINISSLTPGIYFLTIRSQSGVGIKKFVKN